MIDRRNFLASAAASSAALSFGATATTAAETKPKLGKGSTAENVIMIWLGGGMSQVDTFDPKTRGDSKSRKPGTDYDVIPTCVNGVKVTQHLRRVADRMDRITAIRSVNHGMIDEHAAAVNWVHVGRPVTGTIQYPSIGSAVSPELGPANEGSPAYVVIGFPNVARSPGFLGSEHGYFYLTDVALGPRGLSRPSYVDAKRNARRTKLLAAVRESSLMQNPNSKMLSDYDKVLSASQRLSGESFMKTFDLSQENAETRSMYGGDFGQRLLLARRLTERGVRFVEVAHNLNFVNGTGWDTHQEGQQSQWILIDELDQGLAALIDDLERHKRLDKTLIVVATEFGRPDTFDGAGGRGHQSSAFTMVLAGGGLNHCGAYGRTDRRSKKILADGVSIPDFHATIHHALGIDFTTELYDGDRPVPITDNGNPIKRLFT